MKKTLLAITSALVITAGYGASPDFNSGERTMEKTVFFKTRSWRMAANLYLPKGFDETGKYPAITVVHPAGGVKEQVAGLYARKLAEEGFITLAFDASFQGESGGEPRFQELPAERVEDVRAAVDYLVTLPFVDEKRIGALGICAGGGYAFHAAQTEARIKAVAGVSAFDLGRVRRQGLFDALSVEDQRKKLEDIAEQRTREARGEAVKYAGYVPNSKESIPADAPPMYAEGYTYYRDSEWTHPRAENKYMYTNTDKAMAFTAFDSPQSIAPRATFWIVGEKAESAYMSKEAYEKALQPKAYAVVPGASHMAMYYHPEYVAQALEKLTDFYNTHLEGVVK